MTIGDAALSVGLTAVGVVLGYIVAVGYDRRKTSDEFKKAHNLSMNALVSSLKTNSKYIHQMFTVEFPASLHPTYPLDTTALAFINFGARPYLPQGTDWPSKFNRLRFEMEHANQRLLMDFIGHTIHRLPIDAHGIQAAYHLYNNTGQIDRTMISQHMSGTVGLLLACKRAIDEQIQELEKFGYKGEVIQAY